MKKRSLVLAVLVALMLGFLSVSLVPSAHAATRGMKPTISSGKFRPLINYTPCNNSQFLEIYSSTSGYECFANDGYLGLGDPGNGGDLYNVTYLHSGNNNGWIRYYDRYGGHTFYFYAYYEYNFGNVEVTQVDITGQS